MNEVAFTEGFLTKLLRLKCLNECFTFPHTKKHDIQTQSFYKKLKSAIIGFATIQIRELIMRLIISTLQASLRKICTVSILLAS